MEIKEVRVQIPLTSTSTSSIFVPNVFEPLNDEEKQQINDHEVNNEPVVERTTTRNNTKKISKIKKVFYFE